MNDEEEWRPIPEFEGYEVSSHGRVRSYWLQAKGCPYGWTLASSPQRLLSTNGRNSRPGYPAVCINKQSRTVHCLVMLAFHGPPPDGLIVCHNDDNPENNHLDNLRYDTHKSNTKDARNSGSIYSGFNGKFAESQVIQIRERAASGEHPTDIAEEYGVKPSTIFYMCRGITYTDFGGPQRQAWPRRKYRHPHALSDNQVQDIRIARAGGAKLRTLAAQYDVSESFISLLCRNKRRTGARGPVVPLRFQGAE